MSSVKTKKSCGPNQNAERLKALGNELHQKGQYKAAYEKYTEAIKEDPTNPIYYANRAASNLELKEYMDGSADAKKATELDPKYAKAWSRLATAEAGLSSWSKSVAAWKTALACLPSEGQSTETEKRLRTQFTAGLKKAEKALNTPLDQNAVFRTLKPQEMPWTKALALEKQLIDANEISSGLVIIAAYRDFQEGVDLMKKLEKKMVNGQMTWVGKPTALEVISNGIMQDSRVFHMDCADWTEKYNKQVMFEAQVHQAWTEGGAKLVKKEALQRLKRSGWSTVRPGLAITIRAWLMCGFMASSLSKHLVALEYYARVVDVLDWGSQLWQDVSRQDRGTIFEKTFIRGVKRMRLEAIHKALADKVKDCPVTMEQMAELSRDLIAETEANPPTNGEVNGQFFASFWLYPRGEALSILAWYHTQLGLVAQTAEEANTEFADSANYYIQAAESCPMDDENFPTFLKAALEAYWWQPEGKKLKDTMVLMMRIHKSLPKFLKFWEHSAISVPRDQQLDQALAFALNCDKALHEGIISLEDVVKPQAIRAMDKWGGENVVYL